VSCGCVILHWRGLQHCVNSAHSVFIKNDEECFILFNISVLNPYCLPSYPSNGATIEHWLYAIRLTIICVVLTVAVCLGTGPHLGFLQQRPCNPLKNSKVSSTLIPFVLPVTACTSRSDVIFTSHVSHSRSFVQNLHETHTYTHTQHTHTHKTHTHIHTQHDDFKNLLYCAALQISTGHYMYHQL